MMLLKGPSLFPRGDFHVALCEEPKIVTSRLAAVNAMEPAILQFENDSAEKNPHF